MDEAYSTRANDNKFPQNFNLTTRREYTACELSSDGRITLSWILQKNGECAR